MPAADLSLAEARRIALAAQGFDRPRPHAPVRAQHLRRTIERLGLVQIDMVSVVVPAHYHVLYSRLVPYDRSLFERAAYGSGHFTEQWAHMASVVPASTWPLLRHRREDRSRPDRFARLMRKHPGYAEWVRAEIERRGPLAAEDLDVPAGAVRRLAKGSWVGTLPRAALEMLFAQGALAVAARRASQACAFDLAERLIHADHHGRRLEPAEEQRQLLLLAARGHGVGTAADLGDY